MIDQLRGLWSSLEIQPIAIVDVALTALLIYGAFSLIRGTRAVRLVIGVMVLYGVYVAAQFFGLQLLSQVLQAGAFVGLVGVVVVFQPELRRALERIGRVGSLGWLFSPTFGGAVERMARDVARAAASLAAQRHGALIIVERETGLEDTAESGVMLHADLSPELLTTIFMPRSALHDGAVVVRGDRVVAAGVILRPGRVVAPCGAAGHAPSGGRQHHRADRCAGRRGQRGDGQHRPRRAGPVRAQPRRGPPADGPPGPAPARWRPGPGGAVAADGPRRRPRPPSSAGPSPREALRGGASAGGHGCAGPRPDRPRHRPRPWPRPARAPSRGRCRAPSPSSSATGPSSWARSASRPCSTRGSSSPRTPRHGRARCPSSR